MVESKIIESSGRAILILGGSRSGKSLFAEKLADECGGQVLYLATGKAVDDEMRERIEAHQKSRPSSWQTIEVDADLPDILLRETCSASQNTEGERYSDGHKAVIVDCLTVYVAELMEARYFGEEEILTHFQRVVDKSKGLTLIMVSNEVGMGVVPPYPLGRAYRDILGKVNQSVAAAADNVYMMMAGIPVMIKG